MQPNSLRDVKRVVNENRGIVKGGASGTPWKALLSLIFALLYDASPIDLIPDLIPLLGWLDDVVVSAVLALFALVTWVKWKKARSNKSVAVEPRAGF